MFMVPEVSPLRAGKAWPGGSHRGGQEAKIRGGPSVEQILSYFPIPSQLDPMGC